MFTTESEAFEDGLCNGKERPCRSRTFLSSRLRHEPAAQLGADSALRGKVEARGVVKHKLCGLALNRHKIRPIQKLNRFVQLEAPFGMRHSSKRCLDGSPFNQFGQCRNHALYQRVHTSGVGQGQREGESYRSGSLNKSASAQTWASVSNF